MSEKNQNKTIYIKAAQCVMASNPNVLLKDILTIYTDDKDLQNEIANMKFYAFPEGKKSQLVVSILKIMEFILKSYPNLEINNLGEGDFIILYQPQSKFEKVKERIFTFFICLVAFFGGGYAIMAYNTDIGSKELFTNLSMLFTGNATSGVSCIVISYAFGLTLGMLLFFNHLGNKKITTDPTPLEVQMRLYEKDISTTIIKNVSRRDENIDITQ